jgi:Bifunctional DNA primase/polymerase, N-terminal
VSEMLEAALTYAERGWPVFPLGVGSKVPMIKGGRGYLDATIDPAAIRRWWNRWPEANIGVATGQGFAVLDIDPRNGGAGSFESLCSEHHWTPRTAEVHTGRGDGGRHLYFSCPLGLRSGKFGRRRGLDLQADGAYVVAPPSIHPESGREYTWHPARSPEVVGVAQLPHWIPSLTGDIVKKPAQGQTGSLSASVDFLKTIPPREYVEDLTGARVPGDGKIRCPAPGHDDRTPSFHVYDEPDRGWYCFGACQNGGSIYDFAALLAGLPVPCPRGTAFLRIEDWLLNFYTRKLRVE